MTHRSRNYSSSAVFRRRAIVGLLFLTPWLLGLLLLKLIPIVASLAFSFTDFYMIAPEETQFVGLANYISILQDQETWTGLFATLGFAMLSIPIQMLTALGLATLMNSEYVLGRNAYRTLIFLPSIIPGAAIFFVWYGFLDPTNGWLNRLIMLPLGLPPYPGPQSEAGFNLFLIMGALWSIGPSFLIMLGAMQGVPKELYEAAKVDGAGPLFRFANITLPMISPAIFFSIVISLVGVFGGAVLLDRGGAFGGGQSPFGALIYSTMFREFKLGYAAGQAWVMFMIMLAVTIILFRTADRWVYYPDGGEG